MSSRNKKVLIYGSKEFARVVRDLAECLGYSFHGFIDDFHVGDDIVGSFDEARDLFPADEYSVVIAVGYNNLSARWRVYRTVVQSHYNVPTLIHNRAYVRDARNIGDGSVVMANATIDCNAVVGELVTLWPGVVVNHDCRIESNVFLSPNATICGFVTIGANSFVGAGAVIADHTDVPRNSYIKAKQLYFNR